ncbi:hypothetical protein F3Y22_tig00110223pilonHSYRG00047 [Hibiscus syriacus]|uniref:Uncharacterized protein n=1 Tax=Hibiscus syriacus TaxID=106335 RepID=A0A6A3BDD5_HIBSY|nr:uncharacterized protein LOC120114337 [Hibiscus syriacus]XP_038991214.1 uncharacterized protein LOC120114337 [Hibiscus syriacus]KAE8712809.1 hypothetical protein F3Y22_tig00110223pilonHSYRG00047 [Hibiscus syriacus]
MWLAGLVKNNINGGNASVCGSLLVRYMSRSRAVNVRKINPKVPIQEAKSIAGSLYDLIKQRGPLTVPNTWNASQEAGIGGLNSKTHMKIMLKWMRGRKLLKLFCNKVGSNKKFLHCTLPEEPRTDQLESLPEPELQTKKPSAKRKKKTKK